MARIVWEARENNGEGVVSDWEIPSDLRARLDQKIDLLPKAEVDQHGKVNLPHGMLAGPNVFKQRGIYKLIVNGRQALRPMLCLGPKDRAREWTILARAKERDQDTTEQKAAAANAVVRAAEIVQGTRMRDKIRGDSNGTSKTSS